MEKAIVAYKTVTKEQIIDPARDCNMWESGVLQRLQANIGEFVQFGNTQKKLTGVMIRDVVKAYNIENPSQKYYRPDKPGSRAMYGEAFLNWVIDEYQRDTSFFYKAKYKAQGKEVPDESACQI